MRNKFRINGASLAISDLHATLFLEGPTSLSSITFDKKLLDMYTENYIKQHFEETEDGLFRRVENEDC
ncbi:hypothetical protein [Enterococcus cecorum]|uniref:hypothetical protein n=1 Tax=Enterococcus cecorum TaxID=44008 RepID=UPI003F201050